MNPQDDHRYHKLPVWAREGIDRLVRERDEARAAYKEALLDTEPEATNTRLMSSLARAEVGLPNNAGVRHYLTNSRADERTYIDTRLERTYTKSSKQRLVIHGSHSLALTLGSGNLFYVDLEDRG